MMGIDDDNDRNRGGRIDEHNERGGTYQRAHVTMGIDNDHDGNGEGVLTSTMFFPPRKHTIDDDNDVNGGERIDEHMSRWGSTTTTTTTEMGGGCIDKHNVPTPAQIYDRQRRRRKRGVRIDVHNVPPPAQTYNIGLVRTYPPTEWKRYICWEGMGTRTKEPRGEGEAAMTEQRTTTTTTTTIATTAYVTFASSYPIITLLIKLLATSYPYHHHLPQNVFSQDHGRINPR